MRTVEVPLAKEFAYYFLGQIVKAKHHLLPQGLFMILSPLGEFEFLQALVSKGVIAQNSAIFNMDDLRRHRHEE